MSDPLENAARHWTPVVLPDLPAPAGAYSPGVRTANLLFVSGQTPRDPATGQIVGHTVEEQTRITLENLERILHAGGATLADLVSVTVYLADEADWGTFDTVYRSVMRPPYPTRAVVGASLRGIRVGNLGDRVDSVTTEASAHAAAVCVAMARRVERLALSRALEEGGVRAYPVSRPAELAKALRDAPPQLIVSSDHADDLALAATMLGAALANRWLTLSHAAPLATQVEQIHDALAGGASASSSDSTDDQITSSA